MWKFTRGIRDIKFIDMLNDAPWWANIIEDKDLIFGIRNNYLNIYFKGNSLAKIERESKGPRAKIHYKFLVPPSLGEKIDPYISVGNQKEIDLKKVFKRFTGSMDQFASAKRASIPYSGLEKSGVHEIVKRNDNIVDVEITISRSQKEMEPDQEDEPEEYDYRSLTLDRKKKMRQNVIRIDFSAIHAFDDKCEIVFYEAKHFSNKELRAERGLPPPVLGQLNDYQKVLAIKDVQDQIITSYGLVCKNLVSLGIKRQSSLYGKIADGRLALSVNPKPKLIIFGYDADQIRVNSNGKKHLDKLAKSLPDRLLSYGSAKEFKKGISK